MAAKVILITQGNNIPVGTVVESLLTEAQFQALNGVSWVLADNRSIVGSLLHTIAGFTVASDCRGVFLRGKNNGRVDGNQDPAGERALGSFQMDAFEDHFHDVQSGGGNGAFSSGSLFGSTPNGGGNNIITIGAHTAAGVVDTKADANETRVKNVAFNIFLKINP